MPRRFKDANIGSRKQEVGEVDSGLEKLKAQIILLSQGNISPEDFTRIINEIKQSSQSDLYQNLKKLFHVLNKEYADFGLRSGFLTPGSQIEIKESDLADINIQVAIALVLLMGASTSTEQLEQATPLQFLPQIDENNVVADATEATKLRARLRRGPDVSSTLKLSMTKQTGVYRRCVGLQITDQPLSELDIIGGFLSYYFNFLERQKQKEKLPKEKEEKILGYFRINLSTTADSRLKNILNLLYGELTQHFHSQEINVLNFVSLPTLQAGSSGLHLVRPVNILWWNPAVSELGDVSVTEINHYLASALGKKDGLVEGDTLDAVLTFMRPKSPIILSEEDWQEKKGLALGGLTAVTERGLKIQVDDHKNPAETPLAKMKISEIIFRRSKVVGNRFRVTMKCDFQVIEFELDSELNVLSSEKLSAENKFWLERLSVTYLAEARNTKFLSSPYVPSATPKKDVKPYKHADQSPQLRLLPYGSVPRPRENWDDPKNPVNALCERDFGVSLKELNRYLNEVLVNQRPIDSLPTEEIKALIKNLINRISETDQPAQIENTKSRTQKINLALRKVFTGEESSLSSAEHIARFVTYVSEAQSGEDADPILVNCPNSATALFGSSHSL